MCKRCCRLLDGLGKDPLALVLGKDRVTILVSSCDVLGCLSWFCGMGCWRRVDGWGGIALAADYNGRVGRRFGSCVYMCELLWISAFFRSLYWSLLSHSNTTSLLSTLIRCNVKIQVAVYLYLHHRIHTCTEQHSKASWWSWMLMALSIRILQTITQRWC